MSSASSASSASSPSTFSECRCRLTLHLHPSHLANLMDGIRAHLNGYLLTFQPQLSGLVLAYSDVKLLSHTASIFYDRPYLNFPIQLTLLTLALPPGTQHYGRVSKVGAGHVTLLVYGLFHCVVLRADIPAWYEFGTLERDGRRTECMADTRHGAMSGWHPKAGKAAFGAAAAADAEGDEQQLSKKQAAKQQKQQEKEERRQAYLRTQQQSADAAASTAASTAGSTAATTTDDSALDYAIRLGSLVRFVLLSSVSHDAFVSMSGSLTAEGAALVPGDVAVPAELRAREEAEEEERRRAEEAEATSVERLFAGEEEDAAELDETVAEAATEGEAHVSKKELKERKKAEKANRKAAKALRKQLHQQQGGSSGGAETVLTVHDKAAVLRRREAEEEAAELARRKAEDNEVYSVASGDAGYSHIDAHVVDEEAAEAEANNGGAAGSERKRRKREREEAKSGVKTDTGVREKKKRREKSGS